MKLNMFTILLSVNTLCPPLRLDWLRMEVFPPRLVDGRVPKVKPAVGVPPPENDTNYLYEEKQGHWCVVLQQDKIENKRRAKGLPRQIIRLNDDIEGVTNGCHLNEIITSSLEYAPRNTPLIGSALVSIVAPKNPTQNILRKSYVNYFYADARKLSEAKIKEIAYRMRHTPNIARGVYKKINLSGEIKTAPAEPSKLIATPAVVIPILPVELKTIPIPPPEVKQAPMAPPKVHFNYREYSKEYRVAHRAEINKKQSDKYEADKQRVLAVQILGKLHRGQVTRPCAKSILQYSLKQDQFTGKWTSALVPVLGAD